MNRRNNESGQAIVMLAISLIVIMGMAALVLDVGSWFRTDRRLQADGRCCRARRRTDAAEPGQATATAMRLCEPERRRRSRLRHRRQHDLHCRTTRSASRRRSRPRLLQQDLRARLDGASRRKRRHGSTRRAGALRRAHGRELQPPADSELQRRSHADFEAKTTMDYDTWAPPAPTGCSTLERQRNTGLERGSRVDPPRLRPLPRRRRLPLGSGCEVQLAEHSRRARRPAEAPSCSSRSSGCSAERDRTPSTRSSGGSDSA